MGFSLLSAGAGVVELLCIALVALTPGSVARAAQFGAKSDTWNQGWLRYDPVTIHLGSARVDEYQASLSSICIQNANTQVSSILNSTAKELQRGLSGILSLSVPPPVRVAANCATQAAAGEIRIVSEGNAVTDKASEGFSLKTTGCGKDLGQNESDACVQISSATDRGALTGAFSLLRHLQTNQSVSSLDISQTPAAALRIWDLWDNYDRSVERGYGGLSVFDWTEISKGHISERYTDFARLLASVGINAIAFLNVNACGNDNQMLLSSDTLDNLAVVANIMSEWGIDFIITPCFASPKLVGKLKTADPLDAGVRSWWNNISLTIATRIPTFKGFLIKADSEGEPGPGTYGRNQSQGANMLAEALSPINASVFWRAFEYSGPGDRATLAYKTFIPYVACILVKWGGYVD